MARNDVVVSGIRIPRKLHAQLREQAELLEIHEKKALGG